MYRLTHNGQLRSKFPHSHLLWLSLFACHPCRLYLWPQLWVCSEFRSKFEIPVKPLQIRTPDTIPCFFCNTLYPSDLLSKTYEDLKFKNKLLSEMYAGPATTTTNNPATFCSDMSTKYEDLSKGPTYSK